MTRSFEATKKANAREERDLLEIQYMAVDQLLTDRKNPRAHSRKQLAQLAKSIEVFGFNCPILVDGKMQVIAGHGRLAASKLIGMRRVPTIRIDHLDEAQRTAFMIADNRLTENSTWNSDLLGAHFKALAEADLDFTLETTGFDMGEIDLLIEGLSDTAFEEDDPDDALPLNSGHRVSEVGDLWLLGKHRVLCGDSLIEASYKALLGTAQADLVFTDPPYNVPIDGHATGLGKKRHRDFAMASGEMSKTEFEEFLKTFLGHAANYSKAGSLSFICMDWRHVEELAIAGKQVYVEFKNICVWAKDNAGMGSLYRSQHEFIFVFKKGGASHRNNVQLGRFGRNRTNLWSYAGANSQSRSSFKENLLAMHPTAKPVALVADAILDCSSRSDLVLDPFLGSGTTVIAAERTGRTCYGIELDPAYVDIIVRRWQILTGQTALHAVSGKTFAETEEEKHGAEKQR